MSVVYASSLAIIDKLTEALGVPFEALADAADINIGLLNTPDAALPAANFLRLHDEILLQTGNEDFGLLCGRIIYMESFHLYMSLAAASNTFRDWINLIPNRPNLQKDRVSFDLPDTFWLDCILRSQSRTFLS